MIDIMKLTIDTKEDSREDIRKVISMLQHLVGESPASNQPNIFDDPASFGGSEQATPANAFVNMFGSNEPKEEPMKEKKKDPTEEIAEIIPY
jgi:hypothetical protein